VNDEPNGNEEQLDPEQAQAEDAAPEGDASEETPVPEADASEETPAPEESPSTEGAAPGEQPDTPAVEEAPTPEESPAAAEGAAPPEEQPEPGKKGSEAVPGAELDPIALEPEVELDAEERARLEAEAEEQARREAELEAVDRPVDAKPAKLHADSRYTATGKRKSSVARVILSAGDGSIQINKRQLEEYFPRSYLQSVAKQPLVQTGYEESVDVRVRVHGGGISGQAAAVRHGIARALCDVDPQLRRELKRRGMLTRDAREKERRKAGLKKARKKPQFSKR
jgi:small subunit ribosomal protein S9